MYPEKMRVPPPGIILQCLYLLFTYHICIFVSRDPLADLQYGNKIAELVLLTEDTINISDAYSDPRFDREVRYYLSLVLENRSSGFQTRSDTNRAVQPQKMDRGLKFRI